MSYSPPAAGAGAYLNDHRLRVSKRTQLADCLIGTGFPFREFSHADAYIAMFKDVMPRVAGIRRPGSAALDLAYLAAGRYDGFWELGIVAVGYRCRLPAHHRSGRTGG